MHRVPHITFPRILQIGNAAQLMMVLPGNHYTLSFSSVKVTQNHITSMLATLVFEYVVSPIQLLDTS